MTFTATLVALSLPEPDVTPKTCMGWLCYVMSPDPPKDGWKDGLCPDCLDEIARQEMRGERQQADTP